MTRFGWLVALVVIFCGGLAGAEQHALLVGVSQYPELEEELWLRGPEHDVALFKRLLMDDAIGFSEERITALAGWPDDVAARPTRANIKQAFERLQKQVKAGDSIIILFSGHGSQQPANDDSEDIEPDGMDEVFLPADAAEWDPTSGTVRNAIVDDEIRAWLAPIMDKDVFVWIIFDSCHSGSMTREVANTGRRYRSIPPSRLIPAAALQGVKRCGGGLRGEAVEGPIDSPPAGATGRGGLAALFAAQSYETTFEVPMPDEHSEPHGILTYTVAQVLTSMPGKLSYKQLGDRVTTLYRTWGIMQPTPVVEGTGIERVVLGTDKVVEEHPLMVLGVTLEDEVGLDAGSLQGMRAGNIVRLFPPPGSDETEAIGHVKVVRVSPWVSNAVPVIFGGMKAPDVEDIYRECRGELVVEHLAAGSLKLAMQRATGEGMEPLAADAVPARVRRALLTLRKQHPDLVTLTDETAGSDWILRMDEARAWLTPLSGWAAPGKAAATPPDFELPAVEDEAFVQALVTALARVGRARQLVYMAGVDSFKAVNRGSVNVKVDLLKYTDAHPEGEVVEPGARGRVLRAGDIIAFRLANPCPFAIDVSLLFVDSGYGISSIFPLAGRVEDNRIFPDNAIITDKLQVTATTTGLEQVVVMAVRSAHQRVNFSMLEQPTLERTRGDAALSTPLGRLLQGALYGQGTTRGLSRMEASHFRMELIPWLCEPADE